MNVPHVTEPVQSLEHQPTTCPKCNGEGQIVYTQQSMFGMVRNVQTCPECNGTGKIIKENVRPAVEQDILFQKENSGSIPAGIDNGQSIRIRDKGEPGTNGVREGSAGRSECSPSSDLPETGYEYLLHSPDYLCTGSTGWRNHINTVDGEVAYEVKPGTQTDTQNPSEGQRCSVPSKQECSR